LRLLALCLLGAPAAQAQWTIYNDSNSPLHSNVVREVALAADGSKWIATQRAVQKLAGSTWTSYTAATGPAFQDIKCLAVHGNVVWVGSEQGLSRFDGTTWLTYNDPNQLPVGLFGPNDRTINDVVVRPNGTVWLAGSRGIARFDGSTWTKFNSTNSTLGSDAVTSLALDELGNTLWIGTNCVGSRSGVYALNLLSTSWRYYGLGGNNCVHAVAVDAGSGQLFVGTCNFSSLLTIDAGIAWPATPSSCVALGGLAVDPSQPQRVWAATESFGTGSLPRGLLVYDGQAIVQEFNVSNSGLPSNLLSSVALEQTGGRLKAWVGTANQGLAVYETAVTAPRPARSTVELAVLPNPASTEIEVRTALTHGQLALYDNTGRLLHRQPVAAAGPSRLNVAQWPAGLYHLRVTGAQGSGYARFSKE
jgi:ligand-binding sensor domain-containing protein